jgi:hypothetical protein
MGPGLRGQAPEEPNGSAATIPTAGTAATDTSDGPVLRPVATGSPWVASAPYLADSPGPGSPQVLGSFAFGSQHYHNASTPSTADTLTFNQG